VIVSPQEHEAITKIYERYNRAKQLLAELDRSVSAMEERKTQCKDQITTQMTKLVQQLENKKTYLISEMSNVKLEKKSKLQRQLNDLNSYRDAINEGKRRYEEWIGDESLDVHLRRRKVIQLANSILDSKPSMVMVTQPNVKFAFDEATLKKYLSQIIVDDCDQPGAPTLNIVKILHNTAEVKCKQA
ncbi:hypothetical protein RFI_24185, partial [Reticulomyxa filosa]